MEVKGIEDFVKNREFFKSKREEDFGEWFRVVLRLADIVDDRYKASGFYYLPWFGLDLVKRVISRLESLLKEYNHKEERYPTLIPYSIFMKEKDFFEGFQGEGYIIKETIQGRKLEEPLIVRPTSETVMYYFWSLRIRSYRDLPIKVFQTVNIFRSETKMTKPFLRLKEVMFFNESHTAHRTKEESEKQIKEAMEIYEKFFNLLKIPYLIIKTPEWDTFPGALYNYDFLTVMPDGKGLELGSVINLGQKFAKAFDIKFLDRDGKEKYVWQTCYGISERSVGAMLAIHSDDLGLIILPKFSPIQIVIIPIYKKGYEEKILEYAKKVEEILKKKFRVYLDEDKDKTPGYKYYKYDIKGIPLRIDVGLREVENEEVLLVRRDNKERIKVKIDELEKRVEEILNEIEKNLWERAKEWFKSKVKFVKNLEELEKYISKTIVLAYMCENEDHAKEIERKYNREILGFYVKDNLGNIVNKNEGKCIICGRETNSIAIIGKTY